MFVLMDYVLKSLQDYFHCVKGIKTIGWMVVKPNSDI